MSLTLTRDEVVELTGYRRPTEQIAWMRTNGVPHFVGADGRPRVIRAALLESAHNGKIAPAPRLRLPT